MRTTSTFSQSEENHCCQPLRTKRKPRLVRNDSQTHVFFFSFRFITFTFHPLHRGHNTHGSTFAPPFSKSSSLHKRALLSRPVPFKTKSPRSSPPFSTGFVIVLNVVRSCDVYLRARVREFCVCGVSVCICTATTNAKLMQTQSPLWKSHPPCQLV